MADDLKNTHSNSSSLITEYVTSEAEKLSVEASNAATKSNSSSPGASGVAITSYSNFSIEGGIVTTDPVIFSTTDHINKPSARILQFHLGAKLCLILWLLANSFVWATAFFYIKTKPPVYTSSLSMNVSFGDASTNVSVPGIGEASSRAESTYRTFSDPRESYKLIMQSPEVIELAAKQLGINSGEMGKPKITVIGNTTLMELEVEGSTPVEAQEKALTMYRVLQSRLDELRRAEIEQQNRDLENAISYDAKRLQDAQKRLYSYRADSQLSSSDQFGEIVTNFEQLRRQKSESEVTLQRISAQVVQLSSSLGLSAQDAADALKLQSDQLFQRYLEDYSQANAELIATSARYLPDSPPYKDKQTEVEVAQSALLQQGQLLLGRSMSQTTLDLFLANSSSSSSQRSSLFEALVSAYAEYQGVYAQTQALNQQINLLQTQLRGLSQEQSTLDDIERDVKIAEAVFSSNLTRQSLNRSNTYSTYPPTSIVIQPTLADEPSEPQPKLALAGAFICSLFFTGGLAILWLRGRRLEEARV